MSLLFHLKIRNFTPFLGSKSRNHPTQVEFFSLFLLFSNSEIKTTILQESMFITWVRRQWNGPCSKIQIVLCFVFWILHLFSDLFLFLLPVPPSSERKKFWFGYGVWTEGIAVVIVRILSLNLWRFKFNLSVQV